MQKPKILLVGGGNMGRALLSGWIKTEACESVTVIEPTPVDALKTLCGEMHAIVPSPEQLNAHGTCDAVVLAIKAQSFNEVLPRLKKFVRAEAVVLAIAAGKTVA